MATALEYLASMITATESPMRWKYDDNAGQGPLEIQRDGVTQGVVHGLTLFTELGANITAEADRVEADRIQVSDHGAGRFSVQFFVGDSLVSDCTYNRDR